MNRKILVSTVVIVALLLLFFSKDSGLLRRSPSYSYETAKVDKGDLEAYVSASGTVNPVDTVDVVAGVSGVVNQVHADFNSAVKQGDILAQIEPDLYELQVRQSEANLSKAQAEAEKKRKTYELYRELSKSPDRISKYELENARGEYASAVEQLKIARTELEKAESNLNSATIRSPIDGVVFSMNIGVGEFVSPSQINPLFVIAEDLAQMKVEAHVSEADIGKLKEGQEAYFEVDAYRDEQFRGKIRQIRNAPVRNNNIVTYDVVILVETNDQLKLKPGMTAEVRILVADQRDALRIPTAALRFMPPAASLIDHDSWPKGSSIVWTLSKNGQLKAIPVETGISDDVFTQIAGGDIEEGQEIVVGVTQQGKAGSEELGPLVLPKPKRF